MGRLDITAMEKDGGITRAFPDPMPEEVIAFFSKKGEEGPFTILLDVDHLPINTKYLQVTVDFNEHATVTKTRDPMTGEEVEDTTVNIRLGQRGRYGNLIPNEHVAGPCRGWSYEDYRRRQQNANEANTAEAVQSRREDVERCGRPGYTGGSPRCFDASDGYSATGD